MIWGETRTQKEDKKPKIGDTKISFAWTPRQLMDGRWCWLERILLSYELCGRGGYGWFVKETL